MANAKSTKTGGKEYAVNGLPDGTVAGINAAKVLGNDLIEWRDGTTGAPDGMDFRPFGAGSKS
jgi:hypothetical protein